MRRNLTIHCLWLGLLLALAACGDNAPSSALSHVTIHHAAGGENAFQVEIADEPAELAHGLMGRQSLAPDHGMIFLFPQEKIVSFWMKNTPLFLDMIFIDASGHIVHIHPMARPYDETLISSTKPIKRVLEIKGGEAARQNIKIGDILSLSQ